MVSVRRPAVSPSEATLIGLLDELDIRDPLVMTHLRAIDRGRLAERTVNCLTRGRYLTVGAARSARDDELLAVVNFGPGCLALWRQAFPTDDPDLAEIRSPLVRRAIGTCRREKVDWRTARPELLAAVQGMGVKSLAALLAYRGDKVACPTCGHRSENAERSARRLTARVHAALARLPDRDELVSVVVADVRIVRHPVRMRGSVLRYEYELHDLESTAVEPEHAPTDLAALVGLPSD